MRLALTLGTVFFIGCYRSLPPMPHTAAVAASLHRATRQTIVVQQASERIDANLSRVDAKAVVVKKWLESQ